jgi:hypothetical protein
MQFSAILLLEKHLSVTVSQIETEMRRLAQGATLGDWEGSSDLAADSGAEMISVNGEPLSVMDIPAPAGGDDHRARPFRKPYLAIC